VWHAWHDGALLVVDGDGAQRLPGLAEAGEATVSMRSRDTGGRVSSWPADVLAVPPDHPEWTAHAAALLAARLNLTDPAATLEAWRDDATVLRLVPRAEAPGPLP
jgi:hypothetical protein